MDSSVVICDDGHPDHLKGDKVILPQREVEEASTCTVTALRAEDEMDVTSSCSARGEAARITTTIRAAAPRAGARKHRDG